MRSRESPPCGWIRPGKNWRWRRWAATSTLAAIEARLTEAITAIEARLDAGAQSGAATVPRGFVLRRVGEATEVAKETCATAPTFWHWREFAWPEVEPVEAPPLPEWKPLAALAAACGVLGLTAFIGGHFYWGEDGGLTRALYLVALVAGGWDAAKNTWKNVRSAKLDIHFLMLAVAAGAMAIGAWGEATLLLFLFSASGAMEEFALDRTHREVSALLKASPKQATLVRPDGSQRLVPIEEVGLGDRVFVKPGELFPADGDVVKGKTRQRRVDAHRRGAAGRERPGRAGVQRHAQPVGRGGGHRAAPARREHAAENHPAHPDRAEAQGAERAVHGQVRRAVHVLSCSA